MTFNPLDAPLADDEAKMDALREKRRDLAREIAQAERFSPPETQEMIQQLRDQLQEAEAALPSLRLRHSAALATHDELAGKTKRLKQEASPSWNPLTWLPGSLTDEKKRLEHHRVALASSAREVRTSRQLVEEAEVEHQRITLDVAEHRSQLRRFRSYNLPRARTRLAALDQELRVAGTELRQLRERKEQVDRRLNPVLEQLRTYGESVSEIDRTIKKLGKAQRKLHKRDALAQDYDYLLDTASNSYERAMIHEESAKELGNSSPRAVSAAARRELREIEATITKHKQRRSRITSDIKKTHKRLTHIATMAALDLRATVIDGKNCCYEGDRFIGLAALIPLTEILSTRLDVTVIFDASIRRDLGLTDVEIRRALPAAKVHVVASRIKADETILDVADDPHICVLSNDRFGEFRDKAAVRELRIIRHEILHGRVLVHDLGIDLRFRAADR